MNDVLDTNNSAYSTLTLSNPFGPIIGSDAANTTDSISKGLLRITSAGNITLTTFPAAVAATPEPSSLLLLATGLTGLAGALRRRLR